MSRCMAARSFGMPATITCSAAPSAKSLGGDLPDRLAGAAFAHPDQHDTVARDEDVAAFQCGQAPVQLRVSPPDL